MYVEKSESITVKFCSFNFNSYNKIISIIHVIFILQNVLNLIKSENLSVNIVTFGVLALGCKNKNEAKDLVKCVADHGFRYVFIVVILLF